MRSLAERGYSARLQAAGRQIFIDKTPRYYQVLDHLQSWFPDAPRIVLLRHPLDVAASMVSTWQVDLAGVIRGAHDHRLAIDYCVGHARLAELLKTTRASAKTAVVRYEQMVSDPAMAMVPVWRALGIDPVPLDGDFLDLDKNPALGGRMGDQKIRSTTSVHQQSCGRWRTQFAPADAQTLAEALGQTVFDQLGYGEDYWEVTSRRGSVRGAFYASCLVAREREVEEPDDEVIPGDRLRLGQQVAVAIARAEAGDVALAEAQQAGVSSAAEATAVRAVAEERLSLIQRLESELHDRSLAAAKAVADLHADQRRRQTDQDAQSRQLADAHQEMRGLRAALDERLALIKPSVSPTSRPRRVRSRGCAPRWMSASH